MLKFVLYLIMFVLLIGSCQRNHSGEFAIVKQPTQVAAVTVTIESHPAPEIPLLPEYLIELAEFMGYYFYVRRPGDIIVFRLSTQEYLTLEEITICYETYSVEIVEKIVFARDHDFWLSRPNSNGLSMGGRFLPNTGASRPDIKFYLANRHGSSDARFTMWGLISEGYIWGVERFKTIDPFNTFFVQSTDEAIAMRNYLSLESQRRYTGRFVVENFYVDLVRGFMEKPTDEQLNHREILIEMDDEGYFVFREMDWNEYIIDFLRFHRGNQRFYFNTNSRKIFSKEMSENRWLVVENAHFEDEDTIIFRHNFYHSSTTEGWPTDAEHRLDYRIIFKRVNP